MTTKTPPAARDTTFVVVGDVVEARRFVDQADLLLRLDTCLATVNDRVGHLEPMSLSSHDEFSGTFSTPGDAIEAALRLRLLIGAHALMTVDDVDEAVDVRVGIGHGDVVGSATHRTGPAMWAARDAREAAQLLPPRAGWPPSLRTVFRAGPESIVAPGPINAYLLCQDQLYARMDARDRRALLGLLDGERQVDVAAELGVTQPAIARRLRERGALAIHQGLVAMRPTDPTPTT